MAESASEEDEDLERIQEASMRFDHKDRARAVRQSGTLLPDNNIAVESLWISG
jgi:hypothetical protein